MIPKEDYRIIGSKNLYIVQIFTTLLHTLFL